MKQNVELKISKTKNKESHFKTGDIKKEQKMSLTKRSSQMLCVI